jgi:hypothetical protein
MLRNIPLIGGALAESATGEAPRDSLSLTPQQLDKAGGQLRDRFRGCATCLRIMCLSDFDEQSGFCAEDSPRREAQQAGAMLRGFASALGFGEVARMASNAARRAIAQTAHCQKDGTLANPGTKFCPECGSPMVQPAVDSCPACGREAHGAKFCPECGTKVVWTVVGACPKCGAHTGSAKFCPEYGTKLG